MSLRFNPPPNWPAPPAGWTPPPGWHPDPAWGPAPPGWHLWVPAAVPGAGSGGNGGGAMIAVAAATCGVAGCVPPLWAARSSRDRAFRHRMYAVAAGLLALTVVGITLTSIAESETGADGVLGDLGGAMLFANLVLAVTVAVLVRNTRGEPDLPGVAAELARRRLRERYREVAASDPALARSLRIGRPDLPREVDDGGLLDLNALPADRLGALAGLTADEAQRVAAARTRLGRFASVEEVALYADLPDASLASLREHALII